MALLHASGGAHSSAPRCQEEGTAVMPLEDGMGWTDWDVRLAERHLSNATGASRSAVSLLGHTFVCVLPQRLMSQC